MAIKFLSGLNLSNVTAGSILKLDSSGNIVAAVDGTDYNTGSADSWSATGSDIYRNSDVRIGTYQSGVAPSARLHVFDYQTTDPKLLIEDGNTGDASMQFKISAQSYTMGIDNSDSDKFIIANASGFNLAANTHALEISTNGKITVPAHTSNGAIRLEMGGYNRLRFNGGIDLLGYGSDHLWVIGNSTTNTINLGADWDWDKQVAISYQPNTVGNAGGVMILGQTEKNNANWTHGITKLYTNGTERLRVDSSGNVGIGVSSPATDLSLGDGTHTSPDDTDRILNWYSATGGDEITNSSHYITVGQSSSDTTQPKSVGLALFNQNTANNTYSPAITFGGLSTSGDYMNGAAAIAAQLIANTNDGNFRSGELTFYTQGSTTATRGLVERMRINNYGAVLIGTTNTNSGKADFAVGSPQISWYSGQVQIGGTDMNWNAKAYVDSGVFNLAAWDGNIRLFTQGGASATSKDIILSPQATGGTTTERVRLKGDTGNFGIGTTSPSEKLEVVGTIQATSTGTATLILRGDSGNSGDTGQLDSTIKMLHDDGTHGILLETRNYAGAQSFEIKSLAAGTETSRLLIDQDGTLKIPAYGAGFLTTDANGDVSVDTTSYVDVAGDTMTGDLTIKRGHGDLTFLTLKQENTAGDLVEQKSFIDFTFVDSNTNETPQVRIGAEVGNNDGSASSQAEEGMGAFVVYTNNADTDAGAAGTSLAERFRVDRLGNVGIGTTSPSAKLQVASTGSNGSSGLSDYGFVVTSSSTDQSTLGAESTGDGYANLNLGSNIDGTRRFWHISKRKATDAHKLSFYYYNGTGFSEPFQFRTNGGFFATTVYSSTVRVDGTSDHLTLRSDIQVDQGSTDPIIEFAYGTTQMGKFDQDGYMYAAGFKTTTASTGFLKADGSVDTTTYANGSDYLALAGGTMTGDLTIPSKIIHSGDTDTYLIFGTNTITLTAGGYSGIAVESGIVKSQQDFVVTGGETFALGERAEGDDNGRTVLIEGAANAASGEGSGRIFFTEHNSTTSSADAYGLSLYYEGNPNALLPSGFQPNTGNATWSLRRHNGSVNGDAIMSGTRTSSDVLFGGKISITTADANTTSTTALVLNGTEVEKRTLGSAAFSTATDFVAVSGDTMTGNLTISKDNPVIILNETTSSSDANQVAYISFQDNGTEEAWIGWGSSGNTDFTIRNSIGKVVLNGGGGAYVGTNRILTTADEGTGNGLDADTVDGKHATDFIRDFGTAAQSNINTIGVTSGKYRWNSSTTGRPASSQTNEYGTLLHLNYDGDVTTQLAYDIYASNLYIRHLTTSTDTGSTWKQIADTGYVDSAVAGLVDSAPAALDTLNELAAALGDDANFSTTMSTALGNRLRVDVNNQGLTSTEKSNARTNLGLGSAATATASSFVAVGGDEMTGNLGIQTTSPSFPLEVGINNSAKVQKIGYDGHYTYRFTSQTDQTLNLTCGSYYQAEVIITAHQTNSGAYNNLYIRGIWSNNHTSHHWDEIENIGGLTGSSFTITNGQNDVENSGKLSIAHDYTSGSFAQLVIRVIEHYGTHSSSTE